MGGSSGMALVGGAGGGDGGSGWVCWSVVH